MDLPAAELCNVNLVEPALEEQRTIWLADSIGPRIVPAVGGTAMHLRPFGRTGMQLSVLGFGCGAVGGLMVRGAPADQERTIARALEAGVNYFDTAVQYGDGESEKNLGRTLQKLKSKPSSSQSRSSRQSSSYRACAVMLGLPQTWGK